MAWEFETDPEFQAKLDWAEEFVRDEVEPLDLLWRGLEFTPLDDHPRRPSSTRSRSRCAAQGLWATHLGPELGGQGYGQLKLALLNEILGRSSWAPIMFGCQAPDTGNAEIIAHYGTAEQKERYLQPAARGRDVLLLLDDRAAGRRRPDPVHDPSGQGRRRVGHQRLEVLLLQRPDGVVPHRHGGDQPRRVARTRACRCSSCPTDTPGVDIVRNVGLAGEPRRRGLPRAHPLRGRAGARPRRCSAARARPSPSPRPAWAAGASTTPCAPSAWPRRRST